MDVLKVVREVYEKHHKSIVLILNDDGVGTTLGTGFLIRQEGRKCLVMTCQHVIAQGQNIRVRLAGSSCEYVANILHEHEEADLAVLEIDLDTDAKQPLLEFRENSWDLGVGDNVFLAAYYHPDMMAGQSNVVCLNPTVMPGVICSSLGEFEGNPEFTEIAHSCRSQGGCSGGPLIYGSLVVGVHYQCQAQVESACSIETVKDIMKVWLRMDDQICITTKDMIVML